MKKLSLALSIALLSSMQPQTVHAEEPFVAQPITACAAANRFYNHTVITTIFNTTESSKEVRLEYRDAEGVLKGALDRTLPAKRKADFLFDDVLGLELDTYGNICITTNDAAVGEVHGRVLLYKKSPDIVDMPSIGGSPLTFDYILDYEFQTESFGERSASLNATPIGTTTALVPNWITLSNMKDGQALSGRLEFYNADGQLSATQNVEIPDGGRRDIAAHTAAGALRSGGLTGSVRFVPSAPDQGYFFEVTRFFVSETTFGVPNLLTAFVVPRTSAETTAQYSSVSADKRDISVVEITASADESNQVQLTGFNAARTFTASQATPLSKSAVRHYITQDPNQVTVGTAATSSLELRGSAPTRAISVHYLLDDEGRLSRAYAESFEERGTPKQVSEWNTFLNSTIEIDLLNTSNVQREVTIDFVDFDGRSIVSARYVVVLGAGEQKRALPALPKDTYGTVLMNADGVGVSLTTRVIGDDDDFVLSFVGK